MRVLIFGGSGLIGRALTEELLHHGHIVTIVSRSPGTRLSRTDPRIVRIEGNWNGDAAWRSALEQSDAVVNLAGASIAGGRWTKRRKELIRSSRVETTRKISEAISQYGKTVRVFLNASAAGYYGNVARGDVSESHAPGRGFLAEVCAEWEALAAQNSPRVCILRTGLVLSTNGGALPKFLLPFKMGLGGPLGTGHQWLPWIHIEDEVRAIRFLLEHPSASGPFNLSAPAPVTMNEFARSLASVLRRPSVFRVPAVVLRLILGEMAGPLLLEGQRAIPSALLQAGFEFTFNEIGSALRDLLPPEKN